MNEGGFIEIQNSNKPNENITFNTLRLKDIPKDLKTQLFTFINSKEEDKVLDL